MRRHTAQPGGDAARDTLPNIWWLIAETVCQKLCIANQPTGKLSFSIALIRDPYQTSTHQAWCQARGAIALPPELSGRGKKVACPFAGTPAAVRHCG